MQKIFETDNIGGIMLSLNKDKWEKVMIGDIFNVTR